MKVFWLYACEEDLVKMNSVYPLYRCLQRVRNDSLRGGNCPVHLYDGLICMVSYSNLNVNISMSSSIKACKKGEGQLWYEGLHNLLGQLILVS